MIPGKIEVFEKKFILTLFLKIAKLALHKFLLYITLIF
jgi:hypothetical protein